MHKVFFSYAHDNKALVDQLYNRLVAAYPDVSPWVDRYEIVAGDDLMDKIVAAMDEAEKFFVFLSPTSITGPG